MENCGWYQNHPSGEIYFKTTHNQISFFHGKKIIDHNINAMIAVVF